MAGRSLQDIDRDLLAVSAKYERAASRGFELIAAGYSDELDELLDERVAAQRTQDA
jgi:hypothetical protein